MTTDFLEDACDSLDLSEDPYIIITGIPGTDRMRISSNLGDGVARLRELLATGEIHDALQDHLDTFYPC